MRLQLFILVLVSILAVAAEEEGKKKNVITGVQKNIRDMPKFWTKTERYNMEGHEGKLIWINETIYDEIIFDSSKAKFVATIRPYFLTFVNAKYDSSNKNRNAIIGLADHYNGSIQVAVSNAVLDEKIALAYDITYELSQGPISFYINTDGMTYYYNSNNYTVEDISDWIDRKKYESSPQKFKCPPLVGEYTIYWAYVKKDVRKYYIDNIQPYIKPYLLKFKISYVVDLDPEDVANIKPHQKVNRQILFLFAVVYYILELIWELIFPKDKTTQVKKKSAIGGSKKSKTSGKEDETKPEEQKKGKREKIE